uniref:HTH cro/C1-type domain-containing protein n=1 Tax=uncultured bacterium esnapd14 TaxID=1366594 RepID=S5UBG3_9BACT|nr:hypothetical protein [uncultured bacterium esnapd14]
MAARSVRRSGPDPDAVSALDDLAGALDQLRCRAARGTHKTRVSLADLAGRVGIPRSTLHTYVTGRTLPPVEILDRIVIALGASPTEQAGWADAWFRVAAHRHDHQRSIAAVVVEPSGVEAWQIEQICKGATLFSDWQHIYGGWALREAMRAELRRAAQLLDQPCPERLRAKLRRAVARFAHATGFSAFDTGDYDQAQRYFRFGLACAEESGDWHLRAFCLTSMARQAWWLGRADESLTFAEQGLVRADRLTATERAMLCTARARALAAMHRDADAIRAVGQADEHFAHSTPGDDPPWTVFYDRAEHCGDTGVALLDLAFRGQWVDQAHARLTASSTGHLDTRRRSRVLAQIQLAALDMAVGDPYKAVTVGMEALDTAQTIRSDRILEALRKLAHHSVRHTHIPAVSAFRQRLTTARDDQTA